jgi:hypothetical protein
MQGVALVYAVTFAAGLVFAFFGMTPQRYQIAYPLLALLSGAVGVAVALGMAGTTRLSHLVVLGVGVWVLSLSNVWLGLQSLTGWVESSGFTALMVIVGRLLLEANADTLPTSTHSHLRVISKPCATVRAHRAKHASM